LESRKALSQERPRAAEAGLERTFGQAQRRRGGIQVHLMKIIQNHRLAVTQRQGQHSAAQHFVL